MPEARPKSTTELDHLRLSMRLPQRERTSSRGSESDAGGLKGESLTSLIDVVSEGS